MHRFAAKLFHEQVRACSCSEIRTLPINGLQGKYKLADDQRAPGGDRHEGQLSRATLAGRPSLSQSTTGIVAARQGPMVSQVAGARKRSMDF
jgi:hypothetical protein